jgi:Ser/Thr protein kinase RdoA (MazF antagonist)
MAIEQSLVDVLEHYDLGEFRNGRRIPHGYVNEHWWVETTTGQYFLKRRNEDLKRPRLIEAQHALIQHLRDAGFPAPAVVPTRHGRTFLELQGEVYEVHQYVPGDICDVTKPAHFTAAARTLAWYHNAVEGFDHPGLHWARERYGPTALGRIIDRLLQAWHGRTPAHIDVLIEELAGHARDLTARFAKFGPLPRLIIHGDYYAGNLIFQGDAVAGVVDYDLAHWCFRATELAEAVIYFSTERPRRLKQIVYSGVLDLEMLKWFLGAYIGGASRLFESELRALPHLIRIIWLCASLDPPLGPPLNLEAAPRALPEILTLADWAEAHAEEIIQVGLALAV